MITNRHNKSDISDGGHTLASTMSLQEFGQAMAQMSKDGVPASRMRYAVRAHMLKIMAQTMVDKPLGEQIAVSYFDHLVESAMLKNA